MIFRETNEPLFMRFFTWMIFSTITNHVYHAQIGVMGFGSTVASQRELDGTTMREEHVQGNLEELNYGSLYFINITVNL